MTPQNCSECGRPLVASNGAEICRWRHCAAYGVDQEVSDDVRELSTGSTDAVVMRDFRAWRSAHPESGRVLAAWKSYRAGSAVA